MKILTIRGKNLASIAGEFEINFAAEPLRSAGIFAISGATGAGKSTLLDAMCLALFNNTPRTTGTENIKMPDVGKEQILQGDKRQILRRGTTDGYAEVDFLATNGKNYRAHWHIRRANNKTSGKLQAIDWRVYDISKNEEIASRISETEAKLRELTGMTYEQFTRTVLLAQNDFARFLKARKDEKAEVLEKLTGTEIYSLISNIVYNKNATIKADYKLLSARLSDIHLLTEEEVNTLTEKKSDLERLETQTKQELADTLHKQTWLNQYIRLCSEVEQAKSDSLQALNDLETIRPQQEWIRQIEDTRSALPLWQGLKKCKSDSEKQQINHQQNLEQLSILENKQKQLQIQNDQSRQALEQCNRIYETLKPELKQAREKDIQIQNAQTNRDGCQNKQTNATYQRKQQETLIVEKQQQLCIQQQQETNLAHWFEKNRKYEAMCQSMDMIVAFLDSAQTATRQIQDIDQKLEKRSALQEKINIEYNQYKALYDEQGKNLTIQRELQDNLQKQLSSLDISHIRTTRNKLLERKEHLHQSLVLLQTLTELKEEIKKQQTAYQATQIQSTQSQQELNRKETERDTAKLQAETALHLYETAQIATNENLIALRKQLKPGEPCPICGSCEHPSANHQPNSQTALHTLKEEYQKYNGTYEQLNNSCIRLTQDLSHLKIQQESLCENLSAMQKQCEDTTLKWNNLRSAHSDIEEITDLQQCEKRQNDLAESLKTIDNQEQVYESISQNFQKTSKENNQITLLMQEHDSQIRKIQEEQHRLATEESKERSQRGNLEQQVKEILDKIDQKIAVENWRIRWDSDGEQFRRDLTDAATKWQSKRQEYEIIQKSIHQLQTEILENQHTLVTYQENEKAAIAETDQQNENLTRLKADRTHLLNGQEADDAEQTCLQKIQQAAHDMEKSTAEKEQITIVYQQLKGETNQIATAIQSIENQRQEYQQQLSDWLKNYNTTLPVSFSEQALISILEASLEQINEIRARINHLNLRSAEAETSLKERNSQLERHRQDSLQPKDGENNDNLQLNLDNLKQKLEALNQEKTEITVALNSHKQNDQQAGNLRKELERQTAIVEQWGQLDDLIGSQSGYKFKEIAQGYTLDILLKYANKQLQELTSRYQLQRVPDELAIQIIDHDLCDEIRSVFSLSGGESFLVSLALALGLSSFSSQNHHEENLFIDEGFGTLDAETLQTVLETLERLRSQGRKVGVISHIREMAERIPVQIQVERNGNGKSKIKIVG